MDQLTKALTAFAALLISIIPLSLPQGGKIIDYVNNGINEEIKAEYTSKFYKIDLENKKIIEPVIKINVDVVTDIGPKPFSSGTGFSIKYDKTSGKSYVLTNSHICSVKDNFPFEFKFYYENHTAIMSPEARGMSGELLVISKDDSKDICLMETNNYIPPVEIASKNYQVNQGEKIKITGAPNGVYPIILDSYISNLFDRNLMDDISPGGRPLYLISSMIFPGHSGSPIFNKKDEVIGIVFINLSNQEGPIYGAAGIPLEDIIEFIEFSKLDSL